jgi:hypothetical protein
VKSSKKAGDLLSTIFDEQLLQTAKGYSALFSSWASIAGEKIAAHSRIWELERSIVLVEADHPGWIQILQTKQQRILETLQRRFPDLAIEGISFRLSKEPLYAKQTAETEQGSEEEEAAEIIEAAKNPAAPEPMAPEQTDSAADPYDRISDEDFKASLKRLEQSIASRAKKKKK